MRILLLANNWTGWRIAQWLHDRGDNIVGTVIHPANRQKYAQEIVESAGTPAPLIFDGSQLAQPEIRRAIRNLAPEVGASVLFDYILDRDFIAQFPQGIINLHPAYLPHNRGQYPNVWSIVDGTPAGVTLHYVDAGIDTGDIIARKEIPVEPIDTGETLYRKLERAGLQLFQDTWPLIVSGKADRAPNPTDHGSAHRSRDVERIDEIELDRVYPARQLIDLLRARTFPPYKGAYFRTSGRKVYLRLELTYEETPEQPQV